MKRRTVRLSDESERMLAELRAIYQAKSENYLFELIIKDIYQIKKAKALVPYDELFKQNKELQKVIYELGRLKQAVEDKNRQIQELKEQIQAKKKGFWARLLGL